jgi:hypothetical protein
VEREPGKTSLPILKSGISISAKNIVWIMDIIAYKK